MQLRRHATVTLVAGCLALGIAPAFAAKPAPEPLAPPSGPPVEIPGGSVSGTATECNLGVLGPATTAYSFVLPPDDAYFTLINPATCGACQSGTHLLSMAHVVLNFAAPCEIPVTISIVPALDRGGGCFAPDPFASAVCAPVQYGISDDGVTGQCVDYALPVTAGCCIDGPVFLKIQFDQGSCPSGKPSFCGPAACSNCMQYNFYGGEGGEDLCLAYSSPAIMYVESACCSPTSTAPGSWGKLKTLYR